MNAAPLADLPIVERRSHGMLVYPAWSSAGRCRDGKALFMIE